MGARGGFGGLGAGGRGHGTTDAPQTTAFLARTSGLNGTETAAYKALINGLVSDGIFSLLDALYIFATNTTATANLNLCGTNSTITSTAAPSFAADIGYTGNGTTQFLNTNFNPATQGVNVTANSNSMGVYLTNSRAANGSQTDMGCENAAGTIFSYLNALSDSTGINGEMNAFNFPPSFSTAATPAGFSVLTRTATTLSAYKNNSATALSPSPEADAALALPSANYYLLAFNNAGVANSFAPDTMTSAFCGAGLTGAQFLLLSNRINAYMTALGINVYTPAPPPQIQLSAATALSTATIGTVIGALSVSNGSGSYTFTLTSNPGGLFSISGSNLQVAAALSVGSDPITVHADNGAGGVLNMSFVITVLSGAPASDAILLLLA